jgi:hypothetical protein
LTCDVNQTYPQPIRISEPITAGHQLRATDATPAPQTIGATAKETPR